MSDCIAGCGLAAEPGDVYCAADREGAEHAGAMDVFETSHEGGLI